MFIINLFLFFIVFKYKFVLYTNLIIMKHIKTKPTSKYFTMGFVILLLLFIPFLFGFYIDPNHPVLIVVLFLIVGFFIFNLVVRKSLSFKNYFTSPYNLFTSKVTFEKEFEIPKDLMFEKIIEVINDSKFKLAEVDKDQFEILAITTISFQSWGENLYIRFETKGDETKMKFCSVSLFQMYTWGKNEKNYKDLLNEIESSLTV